jgi:hypothetical protein
VKFGRRTGEAGHFLAAQFARVALVVEQSQLAEGNGRQLGEK